MVEFLPFCASFRWGCGKAEDVGGCGEEAGRGVREAVQAFRAICYRGLLRARQLVWNDFNSFGTTLGRARTERLWAKLRGAGRDASDARRCSPSAGDLLYFDCHPFAWPKSTTHHHPLPYRGGRGGIASRDSRAESWFRPKASKSRCAIPVGQENTPTRRMGITPRPLQT